MSKKTTRTEKPTDLTKLLVLLSKRLSYNEYKRSLPTLAALLCGVPFGYEGGISTNFLRDALDIYIIHAKEGFDENLKKQILKEQLNIDNIIPFQVIRGGKE